MPQTSITVGFIQTGSFSQSLYPSQRISVANSSNAQYLRYATMQQDAVIFTYYTNSVVIPLQGSGSLWAAAYTAIPSLTYAPVIGIQPTSSTVVHPAPLYYSISASAETTINYQWFYQSGSGAWTSIISTGSFTGSATPALTCSLSSLAFENTASFLCVCSNTTGQTSSSIVNSFVS